MECFETDLRDTAADRHRGDLRIEECIFPDGCDIVLDNNVLDVVREFLRFPAGTFPYAVILHVARSLSILLA